jgi:hypothetical protein
MTSALDGIHSFGWQLSQLVGMKTSSAVAADFRSECDRREARAARQRGYVSRHIDGTTHALRTLTNFSVGLEHLATSDAFRSKQLPRATLGSLPNRKIHS